jgi:hypothetical protein
MLIAWLSAAWLIDLSRHSKVVRAELLGGRCRSLHASYSGGSNELERNFLQYLDMFHFRLRTDGRGNFCP